MKRHAALRLVAFTGIVVLLLSCQNKKLNPTGPDALNNGLQAEELAKAKRTITGTVVDFVTGLPVKDVQVTVIDSTGGLNTTIATGKTNGVGRYDVRGIPVDTLLVYFSKDAYAEATITAFVLQTYWSVDLKTTRLIPRGPATVVGAAGGTVEDTDEEGDVIRVEFPPGAVNSDTEVSITHLQGVQVPSYPPKGRLSIATAMFHPAGVTFSKPVMITIPLPQQMTPGVEMPMFSYDGILNLEWQDTGIKASVDDDGLTASMEVTRFGTFSIMPEVQVVEDAEDTMWEQYGLLPSSHGFFTVTYKNQVPGLDPEYVEFLSGTGGLNESTIVYMYEQYYGVSFTNPVTETVYYQSPTGMYPYKVVRGVLYTGEMTLTDPLRTVGTRKCVKRPMIIWAEHDQGCGF